MILQTTTRVQAPAADVFGFFEDMADNYVRWHPDHVAFEWTKGEGLHPGAEATFEERIGGRRQRPTVRFTDVVPDRSIEFRPTSRLVALLMPRVSYTIEPREDGCDLTQRIRVRTGPIGAWLNRRKFDAVRTHMREEGENLKRLVERARTTA
jgi:hypothetical protein